ncbi:MAG TPA: RDD family protein [Candidatus Acidoferrales bacterium]|nr:RDD family protein [Candidatus Acidoferrales bacterium]
MFCSKCGSQVAENAAFCPTCGQRTGEDAAPRGIPLAPGGFTPPTPATAPVAMQTPPAAPATYTPATAARPLGYAGFWLRFVAWIIDFIVLWIVSTFITLPIVAATGLRSMILNHPPQSPEEAFAFLGMFSKILVLDIVIQWLYFALLESSAWQATIGKKTLGLEVTDMAGRRISFARATGRYFGKIISGIILMIGYIMAGFTEKKQALHDMMAGCLVMRKI